MATPDAAMAFIENRTFDEIALGDAATLTRPLNLSDIALFAVASGDVNPTHVDAEFAATSRFHHVVAHGMWGASLISAVLGTRLPGPGAVYVSQSLRFERPVAPGDVVTARVEVIRREPAGRRLTLACACVNDRGETVISGVAEVIAPAEKVRRPRAILPEVHLHEHGAWRRRLLAATRDLPPVSTAVIHPCDAASISGAMEAKRLGVILPILVGPAAKIRAAAEAAGVSLDGAEIVDAPHSHAAAEAAVALVRDGRAAALMKGALHTDEVMSAVVTRDGGLRTERRMSHVFVLDVPTYPKPLLITDAAINIAPDIEAKRDIVQNALDLARALGVETPKAAILSAVESVDVKIPSTVDAAALCKMAERGQITGGLLDGPLAFDNAVSRAAAAAKGVVSAVAGDADILVAPDLEAGNMIAKQLTYLAGAESAGVVLGARVPIMLTSRADGPMSRLASAALAQLYAHWRAGVRR
ncbi:bifunctional enoyl-CoA hydratase/phosphate acetyltransferase [Rubrimonas cliftonensis]|uniref:Phosphate acetyltransferase/phosphate butyryltransferase n=1 Tax=Rubrimonas cliftonensis TaxID=89524 RepID=A0A1H4CDT7_9RHOB|nr:bifunctional enoyl-CoA hydratase/phosphate acetyltransferase [Rubrimonas cliftonensis]SEA58567.1 phosphate acetyltransferase/phosphate butyryltransferase [Rubrimonas cliftonensis]